MATVDAHDLLQAAHNAADRGLYQSAKWLFELADALPSSSQPAAALSAEMSKDSVAYAIAKASFDCREHLRCASMLKQAGMSTAKSYFLHFYARFLASEKDRQEEGEILMGPRDNQANKELPKLLEELLAVVHQGISDHFLLYLLGMLQRHLNRHEEAVQSLVQALTQNIYNHSAWQELMLCMTSPSILAKTCSLLPTHPMTQLFNAVAQLDLHKSGPELSSLLDELASLLPGSGYIQRLRAIHAYNAQDYEQAELLFDALHKADPHQLEGMDIYSNVLFVLERRAKLVDLAKRMTATDRFRPETCCVVGNYHSLSGEHEKAVLSFRKALKLNRNYLPAWTLMGHEYVELKNTHAAIESYRRAVDVNRKDYRAWYGLGQTYEMLEMHHYALHYFQRAAALKPYDVRMWTAVGGCYEKLGRVPEAIKAFKRALLGGEEATDPSYLAKLGDLHEQVGDQSSAASFFNACVNLADEHNIEGDPAIVRARLWLARYLHASGRMAEAESVFSSPSGDTNH
ncbi:hypothetical protein BCR37DRAFT_403830 [Protomyces lactucae-debilis]|uniref:Cdc23 domain-containing protein n=1 Tax=Protomyces lactucae-debilis TaxID=2754530 RepID=A0A1Y2ETE3_PROLT|nr:uncharacterized protein BCR37DRAFT_403830 [Protomyces lactucae-debilis]ORY74830.1 hypothetical protein BCR37DRAFT_403830 [Protomyces lactucae-debilis]